MKLNIFIYRNQQSGTIIDGAAASRINVNLWTFKKITTVNLHCGSFPVEMVDIIYRLTTFVIYL